jgi:hypothetical protein
MTDKPNDKKDQLPPDPKRPHATLDLKATELKPDAKAAASGSGSDPQVKPAGPSRTEPPKAGASIQRTPSAFTRIVTHLAAGLAGGTVVLFGGDRLAQTLGFPATGANVQQVASGLDKRIAALEAAPKTDAYAVLQSSEDRLAKIDGLAADIDTLRTAQVALAERADGLSSAIGGNQGLAAVDTRIAALEDQLKTLSAAASSGASGDRIADLAAVTTRISESETRFSGEVSKLRDGIARAIDEGLAVREDISKTDIARLTQAVEKLKAEQTRLDKSVQAAQEEAGRIASKQAELKSTFDQQSKTFARTADVAAAVEPVTGLVAKMEGSLDSVLQKEKERQSNTERIVTALELGTLKRAVESGEPFAEEFDAVTAASGGRLDLQPLEPFKTKGVPSLAELKEEFRPALRAVLDADDDDPNASIWDRLLARATSVVRIRRVDAANDDQSVEAIMARMEHALDEGRLPDVLSQSRELPSEAAPQITPWTNKVAARQTVDEAIATVEAELKAALTAQPAASPATGNE